MEGPGGIAKTLETLFQGLNLVNFTFEPISVTDCQFQGLSLCWHVHVTVTNIHQYKIAFFDYVLTSIVPMDLPHEPDSYLPYNADTYLECHLEPVVNMQK